VADRQSRWRQISAPVRREEVLQHFAGRADSPKALSSLFSYRPYLKTIGDSWVMHQKTSSPKTIIPCYRKRLRSSFARSAVSQRDL
jgi:hypothetical protein